MKLWLTRTLAATGLLWLLLTFTPIVNWWAQWLSAGYSDEARPVLIVFAGDTLNERTVGYSTYLRCAYAAMFWQSHHPQEIILSGGPAPLMADLLAAQGVPRDILRLEGRSTNTRENVAEIAKLRAGDTRPVTLLTSDFHMRRVLRLANHAGFTAVPFPVPDILKRSYAHPWERPGLAWELATETAKLTWETLRN